jgi:hypothetical protein
MYFSWIFKSSALIMRITTQRNLTSAQNYHNIKNKHRSIQAKPTPATIFPILYFIIALLITLHIDFPLLGIVSDLLYIYIIVLLIAFSYALCLRNYQKELYTLFYHHSHFSYLVVLKVVLSLQIVEKSPLVSSLRKDYCLLPNNLISHSWL